MTGLFTVLIASLGFSSHDQPKSVHQVEARPVWYSYVDLVDRLTNLEQLAELPTAGETSGEWTSRDRASTYDSVTGHCLNWGANNDGDAVICIQPDGGAVLAEMSGPGCIWRIWAGTPADGHVRIFLDGANAPAIDLAFQDYFNSNYHAPPLDLET